MHHLDPDPIIREAELAARAGTVHWCHLAQAGADEYLTGYQAALIWLRTHPPRDEADYLVETYLATRPGGTNDQATIWVDATRLTHFVQHIRDLGLHPEVFEIEDGTALKARYVRDYGDHLIDTFNPPSICFAWPAIHRLYEGFGAAIWHALDE
jgi:hypothetical protein